MKLQLGSGGIDVVLYDSRGPRKRPRPSDVLNCHFLWLVLEMINCVASRRSSGQEGMNYSGLLLEVLMFVMVFSSCDCAAAR